MSAVEIVSRIEPRRKWSAAEKAALLAEVDTEGGRVTLVARRTCSIIGARLVRPLSPRHKGSNRLSAVRA
jgi:hypothetical protein